MNGDIVDGCGQHGALNYFALLLPNWRRRVDVERQTRKEGAGWNNEISDGASMPPKEP